jgi:alpha-glucosidase (family GH31 glycosyl hydrolase)
MTTANISFQYRFILIICLLVEIICSVYTPKSQWLRQFKGSAPESLQVRAGRYARFTVLSEAVIRMEYDPTGVFDDSQTINIVNRHVKAVPFTKTIASTGEVVLSTRLLKVEYNPSIAESEGFFSQNSLSVSLLTFPFGTWQPGSVDSGNLHGTIRTLDRVGESLDLTCLVPRDYMTYYAHCEEGLVSIDGWVVVDDSIRPRFDTNEDGSSDRHDRHSDKTWDWVRAPPSQNVDAALAGRQMPYQDLYFFGHGRNYSGALSDYVQLAGPIPLLPRYALGPGFSRWYAWNQGEEYSIMQDGFGAHGLPVDLLSVDMDWHFTYPHGLPNSYDVQIEGWTGYSTDPVQFPDFGAFFRHMKRRGIYVNLNMHPAAGVEFHETAYPAVAKAVGIDPKSGQTVAFDIENQTYSAAVFEHALKPLEDLGMDFWWMDFQHGPFTKVAALNPTFMCNYAYWTNPWRYGDRTNSTIPGANGAPGARARDRPFIMGRWGGLGGHRYPIGFAGDTAVKWQILRYETYFSPTSANVGFMWTHDIGGFEGNPPPELLTRWVQWGTFSSMLRTHSSKMSPARSPWLYSNPYLSVMRSFYRLRAKLLPYLSLAQRRSYETGHQMLRPMYWSFPFQEAAYRDQALHQYFFGGPSIWCAPIANPVGKDGSDVVGVGLAPMDALAARSGKLKPGVELNKAKSQQNGLVEWTLWVPPGPWIEWFSWSSIRGHKSTASASEFNIEDSAAHAGGWSVGAKSGSYLTRNFSISEMPVYSPPGAIIPMRNIPDGASQSVLGLATQQWNDMAFWIMPLVEESGLRDSGVVETSETLYDDDGLSIDYDNVEGAMYYKTEVSCKWERSPKNTEKGGDSLLGAVGKLFGSKETKEGKEASQGGDSITFTINEAVGNGYDGFPTERTYTLRFIGTLPPASIKVNGKDVTRDQAASPDDAGENSMWESRSNSWAFHGPSLSTYVRLGVPLSTHSMHKVELRFSKNIKIDNELLTSGIARATARTLACKDEIDRHYGLVYPPDVQPVLRVSATATALSSSPDATDAMRLLKSIEKDVTEGLNLLKKWQIPPAHAVGNQMQAHCVGQLLDAKAIVSGANAKPLDENDPRRGIAHAKITFKSDISKSAGSAPGQASQYSGSDDVEEGGVEVPSGTDSAASTKESSEKEL